LTAKPLQIQRLPELQARHITHLVDHRIQAH
jgi:hypothetical protein